MIPNSKLISPTTLINPADSFRSVMQAPESSAGFSLPNPRADTKQTREVFAVSTWQIRYLSRQILEKADKNVIEIPTSSIIHATVSCGLSLQTNRLLHVGNEFFSNLNSVSQTEQRISCLSSSRL